MAITTKDSLRIVSEMILSFIQKTQRVTDFNVGSVVRTIMEAVAVSIGEVYTQMQNLYNGTRIDTATNGDLEQLGKLVGIERKQGNEAVGEVTFKLATAPSVPIAIAANSLVAAITSTTDLKFKTTALATIPTSVLLEAHTYIKGNVYYRLGDFGRFFTGQVLNDSGGPLTVGVDYNVINFADYLPDEATDITLIEGENADDILSYLKTLIDDCSSTVPWTATANGTLAVFTGQFTEGSSSLALNKSAGGPAVVTYSRSIAPTDLTTKKVFLDYYLTDLSKVASVQVRLGSNSGNYYFKDFTPAQFWQTIPISSVDNDGSVGTPVITSITYIAVVVTYNNPATTTVVSGQQLLDNIIYRDAVTLNLANKIEGSASLQLYKLSTTQNYWKFVHFQSIADLKDKKIFGWVNVVTPASLSVLNAIRLEYGQDESNYFYEDFLPSEFTANTWKYIVGNTGQRLVGTVGSPSLVGVNYQAIRVITNNNADTIPNGDILIDAFTYGEGDYYEGQAIQFLNRPAAPLTWTADYSPLSADVEVEAEAIGEAYNVDRLQIVKFISSFDPAIVSVTNYLPTSLGEDVESDADLRERILRASDAASKATKGALTQNLLAIEGISDVRVIDLPQFDYTETQLYTGINTINLSQNDLVEIDTIDIISGGSPVTLTDADVSVDYLQSAFTFTTVFPDVSTNITINYKYMKLGLVQIYLKTPSALTGDLLTDVNTVIEDTRAAGILVEIKQPTYIPVNIDVDVYLDSSFDSATKQTEIQDAISSYIGDKKIGDNLYVAEIIDLVMDIEGVENVVVNSPAADITVDDLELVFLSSNTVNIIPVVV